MAEFCVKCWNKINGTENPPSMYVLSEDLDLCEGCGEWTNVIVKERRYYSHSLAIRFFGFVFKMIYEGLHWLWEALISLYKNKKTKK